MEVTQTSAKLMVAGGLLCLKRRGVGHFWEITLYEHACFAGNPFVGGMSFLTAELSPASYVGRTFEELVDAENFILGLLAA